MKRGSFLVISALFCLLTVSHIWARPVSFQTGAEALEKSGIIVAIQTSGFEVARRGNDEWLIFKPSDLKTFKGAVPISEVRIRFFADEEYPMGHFEFPQGPQWLLFFLKDLGGGRYKFALDPLSQGEIGVPSDVDPSQCTQIDDLLVAVAESASRTPGARRHCVFLLLAGLPSEKAQRCLSSLSQSQDLDVAMDAVAARIRGRDPDAFETADRLLKRADLRPPARRILENLLQNYGLSKKEPSQPNL